MNSPGPPSQRKTAADVFWSSTFVSRFDWKLRNAGRITHPLTGAEVKVAQDVPAQSFRRYFGEVMQFAFKAGFIKRSALYLCAITLYDRQLSEDILRRISTPEGLDFQEDSFYCVGVFSPAGWPEERKKQIDIWGNAHFYLVEKGEATYWHVSGPKGPLQSLFDPETLEEKVARATQLLKENTDLTLQGNTIPLEQFLDQHFLDRVVVDTAIEALPGRFQIMEHRGKSYIQRSVG
jgi:hypothetical protein